MSHDDLVAKMRLMSLIALGTESATGEVQYDAVQAALQVRLIRPFRHHCWHYAVQEVRDYMRASAEECVSSALAALAQAFF